MFKLDTLCIKLCKLLILFLILFIAGPMQADDSIDLKILSVNDLHDQLLPHIQNNTSVGGAMILAGYLLEDLNGTEYSVLAVPGDFSGVSESAVTIFQDETAVLFLNEFSDGEVAKTNVIVTPGTHDFDYGFAELQRKVNGGNGDTIIPHLVDPYPGLYGDMISANIAYPTTGELAFAPSVVKEFDGVHVAFIGATTTETHYISKGGMEMDFLNESDSINAEVKRLQNDGIHAFVVLLHEGGFQEPYEGDTRDNEVVTGKLVDIVSSLDGDVDVVLSGNTHNFTNAYLPNSAGNQVLVTQGYSYNTGYSEVDTIISKESGDIVSKSARIVTLYPPDVTPDGLNATQTLIDEIKTNQNQEFSEVVMNTLSPLTREKNIDGESLIYNFVTDAEHSILKTDVLIMNEKTIRLDLDAGDVTLGQFYSMFPFHDEVFLVNMSGKDLLALIEQQWTRTIKPENRLHFSGLSYIYNETNPDGKRVVSTEINGQPLIPDKIYSVGIPDYLYAGGDGYVIPGDAVYVRNEGNGLEILLSYIKTLNEPVNIKYDGRILRTE